MEKHRKLVPLSKHAKTPNNSGKNNHYWNYRQRFQWASCPLQHAGPLTGPKERRDKDRRKRERAWGEWDKPTRRCVRSRRLLRDRSRIWCPCGIKVLHSESNTSTYRWGPTHRARGASPDPLWVRGRVRTPSPVLLRTGAGLLVVCLWPYHTKTAHKKGKRSRRDQGEESKPQSPPPETEQK